MTAGFEITTEWRCKKSLVNALIQLENQMTLFSEREAEAALRKGCYKVLKKEYKNDRKILEVFKKKKRKNRILG